VIPDDRLRHFKGQFTEFPEACKKVLARNLEAKTDGSLERLQGTSWSSKRNADHRKALRKDRTILKGERWNPSSFDE